MHAAPLRSRSVLAATSPWGAAGRARAAVVDATSHRRGGEARPTLLFYGGRIHHEKRNDDPAGRAQLWLHHATRPGFRIVQSWVGNTQLQLNATFAEEMSNATFCYSPLGHDAGDTDRYIPAIMFGCIPVMLTSSAKGGQRIPMALPLEEHPAIDWASFSVLVDMEDLPQLHDILGRITHSDVRRMRHAMARVWHRFLWTTIYGSYLGEDTSEDAFETLMGVLRWRLPAMGLASREELEAQDEAAHAAAKAARRAARKAGAAAAAR
jgi:hypothetical protein